MKLNKTKGFTLVELLGVVAIIAVLATVSITSISGAVQGGRVASSKRQIQSLNSAYQNYMAAGGTMPFAIMGNDQVAAGTAIDFLLTKVTLPESNQQVGPFLLARPPHNAAVLHADGTTVGLFFSQDTGFTNSRALE
jgi:prepilin-type N-terminal cleavage/methylation domain-containing protein